MAAHLGAPATHRSVSPELAAVVGVRSDAGQRGNLPSLQRAELWHVGQEGGGDDGADTGQALHVPEGGAEFSFILPALEERV